MYQTNERKHEEYLKRRGELKAIMPKSASHYLVREIELLKLQNDYLKEIIEDFMEYDRERSKDGRSK